MFGCVFTSEALILSCGFSQAFFPCPLCGLFLVATSSKCHFGLLFLLYLVKWIARLGDIEENSVHKVVPYTCMAVTLRLWPNIKMSIQRVKLHDMAENSFLEAMN